MIRDFRAFTGLFPMSAPDWRAHFGPAFGLLDEAKRPGYEVY